MEALQSTQPSLLPSKKLRWITSTDGLEGFKSCTSKSTVRTHAMNDHVSKRERLKKWNRQVPTPQTRRRRSSSWMSPIASSSRGNVRSRRKSQSQVSSNDSVLNLVGASASRSSEDEEVITRVHPYWSIKRYSEAFGVDNVETVPHSKRKKIKIFMDYESWMEGFPSSYRPIKLNVRDLYKPGDSFGTMPYFDNRGIDVDYIKHHCIRFLASQGAVPHWGPLAMSSRHSAFANLCFASAHHDAVREKGRESPATIALRTGAIGYIHMAIEKSEIERTGLDNSLVQALIYLVCSDLITGDLQSLRLHEDGLEMMTRLAGGARSLGLNGLLAALISMVSFHSAIIREGATSLTYHQHFDSLAFSIPEDSTSLPESPVYSPLTQLPSVHESVHCSGITFKMLCEVAELTNLCLVQKASRVNTASAVEASRRMHQIYNDVMDLPSAGLVHRLVYDDWVYEACRLAACIYATAIHKGIPMSKAAASLPNPRYHPMVPPILQQHHSILSVLKAILVLANTSYCWVDLGLGGVFYWIAMVGSAACSSIGAEINANHVSREDIITRNFMVAKSTQCMARLAFDHTDAVLISTKRMADVVEILGSE